MFKQYYLNESKNLIIPDQIEHREFGFFYWDKIGVMQRHFGFDSVAEFKNFLIERAPQHAYISAAYYDHPSAPTMDEKGRFGTNFIIDIDADHLQLSCQKDHDTFKCKKCGSGGFGTPPSKCKCGEKRFDTQNWICDNCLNMAKSETLRTIEDFLIPDFGINKSEILVKFSGNRGYHVEINAEEYKTLGQNERQELIDYLLGTDLDLDYTFFVKKEQTQFGWQRRLKESYEKLFQDISNEKLRKYKLNPKIRTKFVEYSDRFLRELENNPTRIKSIDGFSGKNIGGLTAQIVSELNAKIDAPVSTDMKRLLRLPSSLHGKTGFSAKRIPLSSLQNFDPLKEAIAFKRGEVYLVLRKSPEFRIGDATYGPFKGGEKRKMPMAAAIFSIAKRIAEFPKKTGVK